MRPYQTARRQKRDESRQEAIVRICAVAVGSNAGKKPHDRCQCFPPKLRGNQPAAGSLAAVSPQSDCAPSDSDQRLSLEKIDAMRCGSGIPLSDSIAACLARLNISSKATADVLPGLSSRMDRKNGQRILVARRLWKGMWSNSRLVRGVPAAARNCESNGSGIDCGRLRGGPILRQQTPCRAGGGHKAPRGRQPRRSGSKKIITRCHQAPRAAESAFDNDAATLGEHLPDTKAAPPARSGLCDRRLVNRRCSAAGANEILRIRPFHIQWHGIAHVAQFDSCSPEQRQSGSGLAEADAKTFGSQVQTRTLALLHDVANCRGCSRPAKRKIEALDGLARAAISRQELAARPKRLAGRFAVGFTRAGPLED